MLGPDYRGYKVKLRGRNYTGDGASRSRIVGIYLRGSGKIFDDSEVAYSVRGMKR